MSPASEEAKERKRRYNLERDRRIAAERRAAGLSPSIPRVRTPEQREAHNAYHRQYEAAKRAAELAAYPQPARPTAEERKAAKAAKRKATRESQKPPSSAAFLAFARPPVAYESPFPVSENRRRTPVECDADLLGYLVVSLLPCGQKTVLRDMGTFRQQFHVSRERMVGRGFAARTPFGLVATPLGESALPQILDVAREDRIASLAHGMLNDKGSWRRRIRGAKAIGKDDRYHVLAIGRCQHCGWSVENGARLEVDHIMPVAKGGGSERSNLQALCVDCNQGKSDHYDPI